MHNFEIEIKSLLGNKENADNLVEKMKQTDDDFKELKSHKQLNHYFTRGNLANLYNVIQNLLDTESQTKLKDLTDKVKAISHSETEATNTQNFSVRTREANGKVILVVKATIDDTTSSNGTARLEWEATLFPSSFEGVRESLPEIKNINDLDQLVLSAGFTYQAKWSRERQEFIYHFAKREISVSIDKNAGYGYLAEFEIVVNDQNKSEEVKSFIREVLTALSIKELPQDRLARMFNYYNKNWQDYYGTDKIFNID